MDEKEVIARRVAREIRPGMVVNLGVGLPTLVSRYIAEPENIFLHGENGIIGMRPLIDAEADPDLVDPGGNMISEKLGASFVDSVLSFAIIRGGHLDLTVVGGLQADSSGALANWSVPNKRTPGMGGAMDLITSSRRVVVAMLHEHEGESRIVRNCSLPVTSTRRIDLIVTDLAVLKPTESGLVVQERAPGVTRREIEDRSEAPLIFPEAVIPQMHIGCPLSDKLGCLA